MQSAGIGGGGRQSEGREKSFDRDIESSNGEDWSLKTRKQKRCNNAGRLSAVCGAKRKEEKCGGFFSN